MKRKIGVLLLSTILLLPVLSTIALAASYNTTFQFSASVEGPNRSFPNANNISIHTSASAPTYGQSHSTFTLSLIRKNWFGFSTIGKVPHPRNGSKTTTWTNVGSGDYRMFLQKAPDTIIVKGNAKIYD